MTAMSRAIFLIVALSLACAPAERDRRDTGAPAEPVDADPAGAARSRIGIVFDARAVKPGDTVGTLVVERTDVRLAFDSTPVGTIAFRGVLALSGHLMRHFDSESGNSLCFEADSASAARMPRWAGDRRRAWFCVTNPAEARRSLTGTDTTDVRNFRVDQFTINRGMSDEVNSARYLVR